MACPPPPFSADVKQSLLGRSNHSKHNAFNRLGLIEGSIAVFVDRKPIMFPLLIIIGGVLEYSLKGDSGLYLLPNVPYSFQIESELYLLPWVP